jgi:hypothetical protein
VNVVRHLRAIIQARMERGAAQREIARITGVERNRLPPPWQTP